METNKLDYLKSFITHNEKQIKSRKNEQNHILNKNIHWINYSKETNFLVENKIKNILTSKEFQLIEKIDLSLKKMKMLQMYLNLVIFTICLRYIEVVVKVKRGGLYFSLFCFSSFYYSNKYFKKFRNHELLKILTKDNISDYLRKLKEDHINSNKELHLNKAQLNKYWKEPMSWH